MPTYEYACKACGEHLEVVQSFKDDALTTCPACGGPLRKVFGSIGIAFKGSGFYRTDSRSGPPKEKKAAGSEGSSAASGDKAASTEKPSSTEKSSSTEKPSSTEKSSSAGDKAAKSTTSTAASA